MNNLEEVLLVEQNAWPDIGEGMVAEKQKFMNRIELGWINLLYHNSQPAGVISYHKPAFTIPSTLDILQHQFDQNGLLSWANILHEYGLPKDWYSATNDGFIYGENKIHDTDSNCVFLIGVGVDEQLKGNGFVNTLIAYTLNQAKESGAKFVLGYGRLPQLHEKYTNPTIHEAEKHLLKTKPGTNLPYDYGARFHVRNGAKAVSVIPNAMDDPESCNYGFLAIYKL